MIKIALIGIVGILLALQIKAVKPEYAVYLCMGVSLLIFMGVTEQLQIIVDAIQAIETYLPLDQRYIKILLKIVGITYIAEFSSDLCKDAGYQTIAGQIQIFENCPYWQSVCRCFWLFRCDSELSGSVSRWGKLIMGKFSRCWMTCWGRMWIFRIWPSREHPETVPFLFRIC